MVKKSQSNENTRKPNKLIIVACSIIIAILLISIVVIFSGTFESKEEPKEPYTAEVAARDNLRDLADSRIVLVMYDLDGYKDRQGHYPARISAVVKDTAYLEEYNFRYYSEDGSSYTIEFTYPDGKTRTITDKTNKLTFRSGR